MKVTHQEKLEPKVTADGEATKGVSVKVKISHYLFPATVVSITGDEVTVKVTVPEIVRSMM